MTKQTLAVIIGAIVLFAVAVIGAMAFTGGGDSNPGGNMHTMQDGSTMTGMMDEQTSTTGGTHTMQDGSMMDDDMNMTTSP